MLLQLLLMDVSSSCMIHTYMYIFIISYIIICAYTVCITPCMKNVHAYMYVRMKKVSIIIMVRCRGAREVLGHG